MDIQIRYGIMSNNIDVTNICLDKLLCNNVITIPRGDTLRANYFTDPVYGIVKKIILIKTNAIYEYDDLTDIKINILTNEIIAMSDNDVLNKLYNIHSKLKMVHGHLLDEFPEQKMSVRYLTGTEKVLELGGNLGRNSLIIASILNDSRNLVTLESDPNIAKQLADNRDINNLNFNIENSALSKRKLIQKGWDTIPSDVLIDGYNWVNTITFEDIIKKYNIEFDTLVFDCEGAFYYIIKDMPEILDNIKLIILENDYPDVSQRRYVGEILLKNNFYLDYFDNYSDNTLIGTLCGNSFEVWKKN
jgi:FkbM family methyltransferase